MPSKPLRSCIVCGVLSSGNRCDDHRLPVVRVQVDKRQSAAARGYGHHWRVMRERWLIAHPYCVDPYGYHDDQPVMAALVDHIKPLRFGGDNNDSNYQSLCIKCHSAKMFKDGTRGGEG